MKRSGHVNLVLLFWPGFVLMGNLWLGLAICHPPVNSLWTVSLLGGLASILHASSYIFVWVVLHFVVGDWYPRGISGWVFVWRAYGPWPTLGAPLVFGPYPGVRMVARISTTPCCAACIR